VPFAPFAFIQSFTAMAAEAEATPNRWCPQPCPADTSLRTVFAGSAVWLRPGSASYSPMMPMTGPAPFDHVAVKAVGAPATPAFTSKPASFKRFCSSADERAS